MLNLLTRVKHGIHKYRSIRVRQVTMGKIPSRYLTQPLMTDISDMLLLNSYHLVSRGTHQCSAKHLWKQLSARHQLGHCTGFSPTVWLEAGTVSFLNPWLLPCPNRHMCSTTRGMYRRLAGNLFFQRVGGPRLSAICHHSLFIASENNLKITLL